MEALCTSFGPQRGRAHIFRDDKDRNRRLSDRYENKEREIKGESKYISNTETTKKRGRDEKKRKIINERRKKDKKEPEKSHSREMTGHLFQVASFASDSHSYVLPH